MHLNGEIVKLSLEGQNFHEMDKRSEELRFCKNGIRAMIADINHDVQI